LVPSARNLLRDGCRRSPAEASAAVSCSRDPHVRCRGRALQRSRCLSCAGGTSTAPPPAAEPSGCAAARSPQRCGSRSYSRARCRWNRAPAPAAARGPQRLTPKFSRMRRRRNSPPRQSRAPHVGCNVTLGGAAKKMPKRRAYRGLEAEVSGVALLSRYWLCSGCRRPPAEASTAVNCSPDPHVRCRGRAPARSRSSGCIGRVSPAPACR
jgi:hypothetical protein